jgi:hypothetical protein
MIPRCRGRRTVPKATCSAVRCCWGSTYRLCEPHDAGPHARDRRRRPRCARHQPGRSHGGVRSMQDRYRSRARGLHGFASAPSGRPGDKTLTGSTYLWLCPEENLPAPAPSRVRGARGPPTQDRARLSDQRADVLLTPITNAVRTGSTPGSRRSFPSRWLARKVRPRSSRRVS